MSNKKENDFEQIRIKQFTSNYLDKSTPIDGVKILAIPKEVISGDFHVVIRNDHSLYCLVADSASHGLSAVMPGLHFPAMFEELANKEHSILTIASQLNDELCKYNHKGYFIAVTLVHIDERAGFVEVLNCGNPSALLMDENGELIHEFESSSLACGILENNNYELLTERIRFHESARLFVFTDGIQDTLIQSGRCKNNEDYEALYKNRDINKCFEYVCSEVEYAQRNGKINDITLVEIGIKTSHHNFVKQLADIQQRVSSTDINDTKEFLANCRILCIDSDSASLGVLHQSLARKVRNIDLCKTVDEAINAYQYAPDIFIIDLSFLLKNQLGLESILPEYGATTPIIITSEPSSVIVAEQLFSLAISRYLRKPYIRAELFGVIQECASLLATQRKWQFKSSVFIGSSLAMTITDADERIIRVNDAFCTITGYKRDEVINCKPSLLSSGKHDAAFYQQMWHSINFEGHWSGEIWNKRKNGEIFLEWITINANKDEQGNLVSYCSVFADLTERKAVEDAVKKLSYYDDLTELPNRRLFKEKLKQEIERADRERYKLALLYLDIDNFKGVNDTLGHDYGDFILKETATRLNGLFRDNDFIARIGGDEFTICVTSYDSKNYIDNITKNILSEMVRPFLIKDELIYLSISIGIAIYPDYAADASALLKNADQATSFAKEKGRNCAHQFTPSMERIALERKCLTQDLRLALKNKEFELFYQPIVNLQTNVTYKAEALIRWHHPELGMVFPDKFIPIAENTGLIVDIGNWVFKQAVHQSKLWRDKIHENFQISINKSPKQFSQEMISHKNWLDYMVKENCLAESITVEITEGVLMDSKSVVTEQLLSLREQGIEISLDDFGTGYSSLAYLRKFDIDYIKIDRQFVQFLETSSDDRALCEAIIVMAHALDIKVIAEGVETTGQRDFLYKLGCDYAQGYLFSKPITSESFERLMLKS